MTRTPPTRLSAPLPLELAALRPLLLAAPLLTLLTVAGCGGESFTNRVTTFAEPTGALASEDPNLVSRIEALAADRMLAAQLDGPLVDGALSNPEEDTAAALSEAYSASLHLKIGTDLEELADPTGDPARVAEFLEKHTRLADKTAAAITLPKCRWDVQHRLGFFSRMLYLDDASTAARLMIVRAIDRALNNRLPDSLADLRRALRVVHELSSVKRVEARVLAANLRGEALYAAYLLFERGFYEGFEAEMLHETLRDQLADWPEDSRMLIGERSAVTHAYEAIRAGMLGRVLLSSEKTRLDDEGILPLLEAATPAAIDADQLRCLDALRVLIESAGAVGPDRRAAVEEAMGKLGDGPRLFASHVFTPDLPEAFRRVAEDRARCEAWAIALANIAKLKTPPFRISPLTGEPYVAEHPVDRLAIVYGAKENQRVVLPLLVR